MRRETISAIRFGYGLRPDKSPTALTENLLAEASVTAGRRPRIPLKTRAGQIISFRNAREKGEDAKQMMRRNLRDTATSDIRHYLSDAVADPGFGARLLAFWSDHFTVAANGPHLRLLIPDFVDAAIRPHIAGSFPDMLRAATLHPAMLIYLNQVQSVGPNSRAGRRREKGLNENLAREVFELHTLGVDGGYAQSDVRAFAELLTGLSVDKAGFRFRRALSEPGPIEVLGSRYGARSVALGDIEEALNDIALHPDTALHIARKLIWHFVGISDLALETRVADAFAASRGDLAQTYAALLDDDRAWQPVFMKAKLPFEFIVSALRAAGAGAREINDLSDTELRKGVAGALQFMGQPLFTPPGPDGWDEAPEAWITPPGLAARIEWATRFAERIADLRDPREFLVTTLADAASPILKKSVAGAQNRAEGIALTLASPEFNRR